MLETMAKRFLTWMMKTYPQAIFYILGAVGALGLAGGLIGSYMIVEYHLDIMKKMRAKGAVAGKGVAPAADELELRINDSESVRQEPGAKIDYTNQK